MKISDIKYRAYCPILKKISPIFSFYKIQHGVFVDTSVKPVEHYVLDRCTVMFGSTLKDINKVEIFEEDIIKIPFYFTKDRIPGTYQIRPGSEVVDEYFYAVKFIEGHFRIPNPAYQPVLYSQKKVLEVGVEKVGNTFFNREILNEIDLDNLLK
jgi:uncharacterized phage protein (TIGR01671 family)